MKPAPDQVTADLRRYEAEQDKLEREAPTKAELMYEAREDMTDDTKMRAFLEDDFLSGPLSRIFRNLDGAVGEMVKLFGKERVPCIEAILQACSQMERSVATQMIEQKENEL